MTVHHTPGHLCLQPTGPTRQRHSLAGACATAVLALAAMFSAGAVQAAACTSTTVLHAATDGVDTSDGLAWANAKTLQGALTAANGNTNAGRCFEIRVKQGVYKPTATTDRSISFAITRPLQLKGGYTGNSDTDRVLNARNTVLSGDIDGDDTGASTNGGITANASDIQGGNSYHVLTVGGIGTNTSVGGPYTADATDASFTLVEGFSVTGGQASGSYPHDFGGGLYCNGKGTGSGPSPVCSPTISNATFSGNKASSGSGNKASSGSGGAIYNNGYSGTSSPTISNATFSGNSASGSGGAIYNDGYSGTSSPTISNATFSGNSAYYGGAIYNVGTSGISSPTISNATFSGNSASGSGDGGAIYNNGSSGTISNATFSGNSANWGGAIYNYGSSGTITASILWGNTLTGGGGAGPQIFATTTVQSSIVQGGWPGAGNLNADPLLGPLQDNGGPTHTMVPGVGSAAIDAVACNVSGTTVTADQRGVARPQGSQCDIGAVEVDQLIVTVTDISPTSGSTLGGTAVTITGTQFTGATSVRVCGEALTNLTEVNATTLTGTTPAHAATTTACDVVVTTAQDSGTGVALFNYTKSSQTLVFGTAPALVVGGAAGSLTATSTVAALSALTTFTSLSSGICTVSAPTTDGSTATTSITPLAAGTCTVAADNAGNADFNAALQAALPMVIGKAAQTITGFTAAPANPVFATGGTFTVAATGGASGNPVTFSSSSLGVCTVAGSTVSVVSAGSCMLLADQAGNANYNAATQMPLAVTIAKASQTLTFAAAAPASHTLVPGTSFAINPLATSDHPDAGRPVTYSSRTPAVCSVSGTQVTMIAGGTCTVAANQVGDSNYLAAAPPSQSITLAAQTSFTGTTVPSAGGTAGLATASFTGGGATCRFDTSASTAFVAAPATLPAGQTMPHGMFKFKLLGCDNGATVTMAVTWPAAVQGLSKYGKAGSAADPDSYFAPTALTVSSNTTTFTVRDGQQGDDDWLENGEIVDPVGATVPVAAAAINPTPVPTLGQWALVLLSLMAAALGAGTLRRNGGKF